MHLNFLNKLFLYLLPLATLPILIHLLFKKKKRIVFTNTALIQEILSQKKMFHRWQKYLLMLIRILILTILIFIFAQPWLAFFGRTPDKEILSVFLFDVSYSMNYSPFGESELKKNKSVALSVLEKLPKNSKAAVVSYSNIVEFSSPLTTDKNHLKEIINSLTTTPKKTQHSVGLTAAYNILSAQPADAVKNIIWFSDIATHGFAPDDTVDLKNTNILALIDDTPKKNAVISSIVQNMNNELTVEIDSYNLSGNMICSLFNETEEIGFLPITISPGKNKIKTPWKILPQKKYSVRIKSDNLKEDNIYYFSSRKNYQQNILVVDGNPQPGYKSEVIYLTAALSSLDYRHKTIPFHQFSFENLHDYNAIIFSNYIPETRPVTSPDKKIILFLGDNVNAPADWLKLSWGEKIVKKIKIIPPYDLLKEGDKKFDWTVNINEFLIMADTADFEILIKDSMNNPFLITDGNLFIFNTTANKKWSDMVSKPFFPLLLKKLLESDDEISNIYTFVGEQTIVPITDIKMPKLKKGNRIVDIKDTIPPLEKPGFYELLFYKKGKMKTIDIIANSNPYEGNPKVEKKLDTYIKNANIFTQQRSNWQKITTMLTGKDVSGFFWLALIIAIGAENMFLYYINKK